MLQNLNFYVLINKFNHYRILHKIEKMNFLNFQYLNYFNIFLIIFLINVKNVWMINSKMLVIVLNVIHAKNI